MAPVIVAKDLYKCYPGFPPVLRGVNIEVAPGEMVAIMGPSGCGKSTMLHVLGMLHAPDSGSLDILGQNVLALNSEQTAAFRRGNMGFVMQASNLFEHSTVFENVEFPLIYENVPPQERWERVIRALELVRLSGRVHYRSNRLSGGEQQRVAIARAMVNNPRILLADEPTGALDARTSKVIMENFQRLCHTGGVAMVMVTHDPKMAEYCDSIYTLEEGVLVCKKHELPAIHASGDTNFLKPPAPLVRGAIVAWRFPARSDQPLLELARRMHSSRLLSRIYALRKPRLFADADGYSLPLAVRRMGIWQRLFGIRIFWKRARSSVSIWSLWRALPGRGWNSLRSKISGFVTGSILSRWCLADEIEFLYATGGRWTTFAAWVASRLVHKPFAFTIRPQDMPGIGPHCAVQAKDAAFIACTTCALRRVFCKYAPQVPPEKVLFVPVPPLLSAGEDNAEVVRQADSPAQIIAAATNRSGLAALFGAAAQLKKKGVAYRLVIIGRRTMRIRWQVYWKGLRNQVDFRQPGLDDSMVELFRNANIYVAWPPVGGGMELAMPWQLTDAMSFGLSIVALRITQGMEVLKAGENCLEVNKDNSLFMQLMKLISDRPFAMGLGKAARRDVQTWLASGVDSRTLTDRIVMAAGQAEFDNSGAA